MGDSIEEAVEEALAMPGMVEGGEIDVPIQPLFTVVIPSVQPMSDGTNWVAIKIKTPVGVTCVVLRADIAETVAKSISMTADMARNAKPGLILPPPGGFMLG